MAGRTKVYEDVDVDAAKDEWVKIACDLFGQPYDDRDGDLSDRRPIREISRAMHLSEVKVKKLLIEGGYYSTKETRSVAKLQRKGMTPEQIGQELDMSVQKVKTLMSYKYGRLYGIRTNSAQRNKAYRDKKKEAASTSPDVSASPDVSTSTEEQVTPSIRQIYSENQVD